MDAQSAGNRCVFRFSHYAMNTLERPVYSEITMAKVTLGESSSEENPYV